MSNTVISYIFHKPKDTQIPEKLKLNSDYDKVTHIILKSIFLCTLLSSREILGKNVTVDSWYLTVSTGHCLKQK